MPKRVLTITMNPAVDVNSMADEVVTNQKVRCEKPDYDPGGGGINVARVLTRLEAQANAIYLAGGIAGGLLTYLLDSEKVPHQQIEISGMTRENTSVIDKKTGEQYRFVFPGPEIQKAEWKEALNWIKKHIDDYDIVVGSGSLPPGVPTDFYSRVAKLVLENGKAYILDTSGDSLLEGLKNGATFIKPNQEEFEQLKEQTGSTTKDELIQKLFEWNIEHIVHTLGKEGTILINKDGRKEFKPPEIEVNSSIGAGDSFVGGLVFGLLNGMNAQNAVC
ncbi:MAG: hexose kinase, partial [Bacteroidetes bacterium]|nr:hexose kinase [Bacteroidota bacterium]